MDGPGGAMAMLTIAVALTAVRAGRDNHPAAFGRKRMTIFAFDQQPVGRYAAQVELTLKRIAAKRTYAAQTPRVNMNLAMTVVLRIEQMDQFPGRTAVEIADRRHVQIAVLSFVVNLKIYAHLNFLRWFDQAQAGGCF